jgi:phenylacetate-CoA ligase
VNHDSRNDDRELFDPAAQTTEPDKLRRDALAGIAADWGRPWTDPLPFYRDKFAAAGFDAGQLPDLDDIPRTTKPELRADVEANPPLGSHRSVSVAQAIRVGSSTGTTGKPWLILYSTRDLEAWIPVRLRYWWRNGLRPGGRLSHSWPMGLYSTGVLGGRDLLQLRVMEIACGPPATPADVQQHLDVWQALRPTAFMVTGSQLLTYADAAAERGFDLAELTGGASLILSEAACQFPGPRRRVEERYGAQLRNISGASEVTGFSLSDCRFHTGLRAAGASLRSGLRPGQRARGRAGRAGDAGRVELRPRLVLPALRPAGHRDDVHRAMPLRRDRPAVHLPRPPGRRGRGRRTPAAARRRAASAG